MSYSREQMIEAYIAGLESDLHPGAPDWLQVAHRVATRYVDSLQDQSEQVKNTARTDEPALISPEDYRYGLEQFGSILSAKTLKLSEQNIAVAQILGGLLFRLSMYLESPNYKKGFDAFVEDAVEQLNTVFPELDTES